MTLLECLESTNPAHGGTVESTKQRCFALQALGHNVELLTLDDEKTPWIREWPSLVHAFGRGISRYGYNSRIEPWVKQNASRFDAVVINGVWRYLGPCIRRSLRASSVPYFVVPHCMLNPWFQSRVSLRSISKSVMWRLVEWKVLRDARAVLFTSEEERRLASRTYRPFKCRGDVVRILGAAAPSTEYANSDGFISQFPHLRGKRSILYLGRLHPMKGSDLLIKAFAKICAEYPDLNLVIAGPGELSYSRMLRGLAERYCVNNRITWTGPIYDELKWCALRSASLFALPSHCEAFPIALLEALACGLPALITDKVNICNDIAASAAGFVDTDTVEGTVRSMLRWLRLSDAELGVMRANALRCFAERFEAQANTRRFVAGLNQHGVNCS